MDKNSKEIIVFLRAISFWYSKSEPILKGIDLTVKKGTIYGLLGSSGCGKTTLLKCILGRNKPISGEMKIFGAKPGSPQSHIPGAGVGYMPQEFALFSELTTEEILTYFGRIYAMNSIEIRDKTEELIKLLNLRKNKLIGNQSGGQQRRISLACTLIHSPPLLILDEPTVGTDPVLRHKIWIHLMKLCKTGQTIILTTHYIEEARNANTVAFMRSGKILAEDEPNILLNRYESNNLEDVFLKLCDSEDRESDLNSESFCYKNQTFERNKDFNENKTESEETKTSIKGDRILDEENNIYKAVDTSQDQNVIINNECHISVRNSRFKNKLSALLHKNYIRITRNWTHLLLDCIFPSILLMVSINSIAEKPTGINLAIFDEEAKYNISERWGEIFINHIDQDVFNIVFYDTIEEAIDSVKAGENAAALEINERLTKALRLRFLYMTETDEDTIEESQMHVHIDRSRSMIGIQIENYLYLSYIAFVEDLANKSNVNIDVFKIPLIFEEPIYGNTNRSLREYLTPGLYLSTIYGITAFITIHMIMDERTDGLYERSIVAGIKTTEFLLSNIITQFFTVCFQIVFAILLPYLVLGKLITDSLVLFSLLLFVQGICGITFGILAAILFPNILIAGIFLMFHYMLSIITCGITMPINNLLPTIQLVTKLMPNTIPVQSLTDIMYRKWTIDYTEVYMGFVVSFIWMSVFLLLSLIVLGFK